MDDYTDNVTEIVHTSDVMTIDVTPVQQQDTGIDVTTITYVTLPLFFLVGIGGNSLSVFVMQQKEFGKYSMRYLITVLALSDNVVLLLLPFNKRAFLDLLPYDARDDYVILCKAFYWLWRFSKFTSAWFIVLISVERFVAVFFPLKVKHLVTKRAIFTAIAAVYVVLGLFILIWDILATEIEDGKCKPNIIPDNRKLQLIFVSIGECTCRLL